MRWLLVLIAGILEVGWASGLKHANSLMDWLIVTVLIVVSFVLLILSYKKIQVAAAYTVFVGIGTLGTYFVGLFQGEPFSPRQLFFMLILLAGVLIMQLSTKKKTNQTGGEAS